MVKRQILIMTYTTIRHSEILIAKSFEINGLKIIYCNRFNILLTTVLTRLSRTHIKLITIGTFIPFITFTFNLSINHLTRSIITIGIITI